MTVVPLESNTRPGGSRVPAIMAFVGTRPGVPTVAVAHHFGMKREQAYAILVALEELGYVRSEIEDWACDISGGRRRCWYVMGGS